MKVILGIGNPGKKYQNTLHNIGFLALEHFAKEHQLSFCRRKWGFLVPNKKYFSWAAEGETPFGSVLLLKPQTYVNLSGKVLEALLETYSEEEKENFIENFLVICDDINLPLGKIRLKPKGRPGGHNGLKSIEAVLGADYQRLRVGVNEGESTRNRDLVEVVLDDFQPENQELLEQTIQLISQATGTWMKEGMGIAMNQFNGVQLAK